ncbi:extracellular lipase-like protein [Trichoderma guizhouense]|uniref:Extracellular lipase-like protein n=1 Tax=Trichoderma guizhouense TaxID=1491466 RepID=A0A1T3C7Z2_9HYPO|nr:extracellular lipase-like protein [Trichoderma guizhouense]
MKCWQLLSLAAVVASSPVPSIKDYTRLLRARQSDTSFTATQQELNNFGFIVQYAGAAYCNSETPAGQAVTCSDDGCPDVAGTVVNSFTGSVTGIGGFVAVDGAHQQIILSFRGSNNLRNFITDVVFGFTDCSLADGCEVHDGFNDAWNEVASAATDALTQARAANPSFEIVSTGHSLGGAVATLAASVLRTQGFAIDVYTFGSPRVGNDVYANFVTSQPGSEFRVTHFDDPVPRLPPIIFDYRHVSPEFWLSAGDGSNIDYTVAQIEVCTGIANVDCNAGTSGLDITAHSNYLRKVSACAPSPLQFKRDDGNSTGYDQETIDRINKWSQEDQAYVTGGQA